MKTILLVEDDPFIIDIYSMQLKKEGYDLDLAQDGETAISRIKDKTPDLVILDLALPKIDGWEVLRIIREDLKFTNLKVVIFSALKQDISKGEKFGIARYFTKTEKTPSEMAIEIKNILS
jgi:DNA-binding response OmpR family regulator